MGNTTQQQPDVDPQTGVAPPPVADGMSLQQKLQLAAKLLPALRSPLMQQAMALRDKNAQQAPPGTPSYGDAPSMNPTQMVA